MQLFLQNILHLTIIIELRRKRIFSPAFILGRDRIQAESGPFSFRHTSSGDRHQALAVAILHQNCP